MPTLQTLMSICPVSSLIPIASIAIHMSSKPPIFVVGVPRSGTTLLAAMLGAHSQTSCGPETHLFRRLSDVDPDHLCDPRNWPGAAVEFVCSINHFAVANGLRPRLVAKYGLDRSAISTYLGHRRPSVRAIVESVTVQYMHARGKNRWVEKTPDHIEHLQAIRKHFPRSPIIRMVRDPRDVALSLAKVPWGAGSFFEGILYWRRLNAMSQRFFEQDPLAHTTRFEDLLEAPESELRKICSFIDEAFEPTMMDTSSTGDEVNNEGAPWKAKASQPIDKQRIGVWRTECATSDNQLAEALVGGSIETFGYPRLERFERLGELRPDRDFEPGDAGFLKRLAGKGVRFWRTGPEEKPTLRVYLGRPSEQQWLGTTRLGRLGGSLMVVGDVASSLIQNRDLWWVTDDTSDRQSGCSASLVAGILSPFRI